MKLRNILQIRRQEDYGKDLDFQILNIKNWSLFQLSLGWNDYPDWPYLQIMMGNHLLFGVFGYVYKFSFSFDFLGRTWTHYEK